MCIIKNVLKTFKIFKFKLLSVYSVSFSSNELFNIFAPGSCGLFLHAMYDWQLTLIIKSVSWSSGGWAKNHEFLWCFNIFWKDWICNVHILWWGKLGQKIMGLIKRNLGNWGEAWINMISHHMQCGDTAYEVCTMVHF